MFGSIWWIYLGWFNRKYYLLKAVSGRYTVSLCVKLSPWSISPWWSELVSLGWMDLSILYFSVEIVSNICSCKSKMDTDMTCTMLTLFMDWDQVMMTRIDRTVDDELIWQFTFEKCQSPLITFQRSRMISIIINSNKIENLPEWEMTSRPVHSFHE